MQLRHVFSELRQGLRRNASMHIAVVLTLFVSLTLAGIGAMLSQEASLTARHLGSQLQVTVWLCQPEDSNNAQCVGEVTDTQKASIEREIEENPEVDDYYYESQDVAFDKAQELYPDGTFEGPNPIMSAGDFPQSYWITLDDPQEFRGITSAVVGLDGVSYIQDAREDTKPIYDTIDALKYGSWAIAGLLVLAALLLVANTVRLAAMARRKEIGIMRLVGASTLYIALPFLLEALVTAALGVGLAAGALAAFTQYGVIDGAATTLEFLPWVGWDEYALTMAGIAILGPVLTVLPTLLLTRKYIKV